MFFFATPSASNGTQTWSFVYDGDGNRVKQVAANGDVTAYVGGLYEVTYTSGGTLKNTKLYYAFGSQVVALRDNGTLYYLHGDNLGSASLTTNLHATSHTQWQCPFTQPDLQSRQTLEAGIC
ncbi:MAG: hypothetical protein HYZ49_17820 [Chloroflexi bacterium]|nr:hypothetical protein [Chloroflexota bacterium]